MSEPTTKKPFYKKPLFWVAIVVLAIIGAMLPKSDTPSSANNLSTPSTTTVPAEPVAEPEPEGMTLAKYNMIEKGMTRKQVEAAIGMAGEQTADAGEGQYRMEMYSYKAANGIANASVTYQGGKVSGKAQLGLK